MAAFFFFPLSLILDHRPCSFPPLKAARFPDRVQPLRLRPATSVPSRSPLPPCPTPRRTNGERLSLRGCCIDANPPPSHHATLLPPLSPFLLPQSRPNTAHAAQCSCLRLDNGSPVHTTRADTPAPVGLVCQATNSPSCRGVDGVRPHPHSFSELPCPTLARQDQFLTHS